MTLVADADIPVPVIRSLQAIKYDIVRYSELGLPTRPDTVLMEGLLSRAGILLTQDTGIPSQAYLHQFGQRGLIVVLLRWKQSSPRDWQQMVAAILRHGESWEAFAAQTPGLISVNKNRSRSRLWESLPPTAADPARYYPTNPFLRNEARPVVAEMAGPVEIPSTQAIILNLGLSDYVRAHFVHIVGIKAPANLPKTVKA